MKNRITACILLVSVFVLCLAFAGCGETALADVGVIIEDWRIDYDGAPPPEPSDITQVDSPAVGEYTGFDVVSWPDTQELQLERVFAVDSWFAQMEYGTNDGERSLVVRIAESDKAPLIELYTMTESYNATLEDYDFEGVQVRLQTSPAGSAIATWRTGDFQYAVHTNWRYDPPSEAEMQLFARMLRAEYV